MVTKYLNTQVLDDLGSKEQLRLLDAVDSLRSQGISQHVSLPQIIVCGDQSSGKSSVLEAISGVAFPVKANTGTRFPTELILRRTNFVSVKVSIAAHHSRSDGEKKSLSEFHEELQDFQNLPDLVENAKAAMGIMTLGKSFSKDILRIEISGPDRPHLTIVDLPGLIHSEGKHLSGDDVKLITDIVKSYMKEPRSVILAVISAKNDYPNQIVLNLARKADPNGLRTLGVITKPDMLKSGSPSERTYVSLAKNMEVEFRHGWHVLRNRDTDADDWDSSQRDTIENEFFANSRWSSLEPAQLGIKALRERLSKLLLHQIAVELPNLREEIFNQLEQSEAELARLGTPRVTAQEQRLYLVQVSVSLQSLLKAAVDGTYNDPFFGDVSSPSVYKKRIRAVIQNSNRDFARKLSRSGHYYEIVSEEDEDEDEDDEEADVKSSGKDINRDVYVDEIVSMMTRNRGRELPGMFNPLIVSDLFQKQSSPWKEITEEHVKAMWNVSRVFMRCLVNHVADASTARTILEDIVQPKLDVILVNLLAKAEGLLNPHQAGHPITYNYYFMATLQNVRVSRQKSRFTAIVGNYVSRSTRRDQLAVDVDFTEMIDQLVDQKERDMDRFAASEALDCSEAYYKVTAYDPRTIVTNDTWRPANNFTSFVPYSGCFEAFHR